MVIMDEFDALTTLTTKTVKNTFKQPVRDFNAIFAFVKLYQKNIQLYTYTTIRFIAFKFPSQNIGMECSMLNIFKRYTNKNKA